MSAQVTTHATLLARLANGEDPAAWREFDERYGGLIRRFARRRGLQAADCEDVAQEVLLALSRAMPGFQYDPAKGKFRSYLKAAALRVAFKKISQKHGEVTLEGIEEAMRLAERDVAVEEAWEAEWRQYHLRQAMQVIAVEFSRAERQAFLHYAVQGHAASETAAALGISVDRVYQAKSWIMKRLTQVVARQVKDEG